MVKIYEYQVIGSGDFPLDMLRHDHAWPAYENQIVDFCTGKYVSDVDRAMRRTLTLRGVLFPTVDRWSSFGWTVLNPEVIKKY